MGPKMHDKIKLTIRRLARPRVVALLGLMALIGALSVLPLPNSPPPRAGERRVPSGQGEIKLSFAPIVKKAAPAVVNVYVRHRVREFVSPFFEDPFFRRFFGRDFDVPRERVQNALGSGVIVSPDGVVVTNNHVIKGGGSAEIKVALADRREFDARVIMRDERTDLAVLQLEGGRGAFPYMTFDDSDALEVGDLVLAIGNPFGVGQTVTSGIVSALARTRVGNGRTQFFIQTDAAINPGNSGGPLVDMHGRVVGINSAIYSRSGGSHGIGFAIPSNLVQLVLRSAETGGEVRRPWLGARLEAVTSEIADALGLDRVAGSLVSEVYPGSPAARAGLKTGDVIISVDGREARDPRAFNYRFTTKGVGGKATLGVVREDGPVKIKVALREDPEKGRRDNRHLTGANPLAGTEVANLSAALAQELGLDSKEGVVVLSVRRGSIAGRYGVLPGDLVVSVNGTRIENTRGLEHALGGRPRIWRIAIRRRGRLRKLVVRGRI